MKKIILIIFLFHLEIVYGCGEHFTSSSDELINNYDRTVQELRQKYSYRLGMASDPFALSFSSAKSVIIYNDLLKIKKNGKLTETSLYFIHHELMKINKDFNNELIENLIRETSQALESKFISQKELQANILALDYMQEYISPYKKPEKIVDKNGNEVEEAKSNEEEKKEESQKEKKKTEEEEGPESYPKLPEEYKPQTSDINNGEDGKSQKKFRIAEVNTKVKYFAQRYFTNINLNSTHPFKQSELLQAPQVGKYRKEEISMKVYPKGEREIELYIPSGMKPLESSDPRVKIKPNKFGGYKAQMKKEVESFDVPLVELNNVKLNPVHRNILTRPIGIPREQWPDEIHANIFNKFDPSKKHDPLEVAKSIESFIQEHYLYATKEKPETHPTDALKAGSFQCDMAAFAMVALLRDQYQIPSRVIGGFTGSVYKGGSDRMTYLVYPTDGHAWIEVYHDGKWHTYDPTPKTKESKEEQPKTESDYSPVVDEENDQARESQEQSESEKKEGVSEQEEKTDSENQEESASSKEKSEGKKTEGEDAKEEGEESRDKSGSKEEEGEESAKVREMSQDELIKQLEVGSVDLRPKNENRYLVKRALRVMFRELLDPRKSSFDIIQKINLVEKLMKESVNSNFFEIFQKAKIIHQKKHPRLSDWITEVGYDSKKQDVNETYRELNRIIQSIELYSKLLDQGGNVDVPYELLGNLRRALGNLEELAHPNAKEMAIVSDFTKNFQQVPLKLLEQKFNFKKVGDNQATYDIANKLVEGKLNDLRLLSILTPLTDFILDSSPKPEGKIIKTWQRNFSRPMGKDFLPLSRPSDIYKAFKTQPQKSIEENIREGTAFVRTRRRQQKILNGYSEEDSEKISIVLYDTSGSMSGDPAAFQAGLIGAFTGRALSDTSPNGRIRHKVVILPFDSVPQTPVVVDSQAKALEIIENYKKELSNTMGGTNITAALNQAFALIADAQNRNGDPLASANIILMTDGDDSVDIEALEAARGAIDRATPLQMMFIAINKTNPSLRNFAIESDKINVKRGFYEEFDSQKIREILKESEKVNVDKDFYYTNKEAASIPSSFSTSIKNAQKRASDFQAELSKLDYPRTPDEHYEDVKKVKWPNQEMIERDLENNFIRLRQLIMHPVFKDKDLLAKINDDIIKNFETITGIKFSELSKRELELLRHFIRESGASHEK